MRLESYLTQPGNPFLRRTFFHYRRVVFACFRRVGHWREITYRKNSNDQVRESSQNSNISFWY